MIASYQTECISTRFLLNNIDPQFDCTEIGEERRFAGINVLEVRRFLRQGSIPTTTVLITKLGCSLPSELQLWYQLHRISFFVVDKPRQCTNCLKITHNSHACKSARMCDQCSEAHQGTCSTDSPTCANCKGNHVSTDRPYPHNYVKLTYQSSKMNIILASAGLGASSGRVQIQSLRPMPQMLRQPYLPLPAHTHGIRNQGGATRYGPKFCRKYSQDVADSVGRTNIKLPKYA